MNIAYRNPNTYIIITIDAILLYFSLWAAHWLRFDVVEGEYLLFFQQMVIPAVLIKLFVFSFYGLYSGMWRYTSIVDLLNIIKAAIVSAAAIMVFAIYYYYPNLSGKFSRSVIILDTILTIGLISMFRISIRLFYLNKPNIGSLFRTFLLSAGSRGHSGSSVPTLVYGADERGEHLIRGLQSQTPDSPYHYNVIGIISNEPRHVGGAIHGFPVLGKLEHMEEIIKRFGVRELLVAERAEGETLQAIHRICMERNVVVRIVPPYVDGIKKRIDVSNLRNIKIEDLLGRYPVSIDYRKIEKAFYGKRIMITGAGGSIGSQLALQLAGFSPSTLILVDKSENYLFDLEMELSSLSGDTECVYHCADITDRRKMENIFSRHKPEYVFHAAAHKHVPMMERNKDEALRNNIGGMKIVADLSDSHGVERFILISTDKAVNPGNVMGATKRVCELYLQSMAARKSRTNYMGVRFGNVLGSNGSVVPLFLKQIENKAPVTVTHPDVKRYFMTIPEAVILILQSVTIGSQGELYLLDMGEPVKIVDLAEKMIRMAGMEPGVDIEIKFVGLRPGEKLEEELYMKSESLSPTAHPKINLVRSVNEEWKGIDAVIERILENAEHDPESSYRDVVAWLEKRPLEARSPKVINFPQQ